MRITQASLLEWRAPYESGAQSVLLRAAARSAQDDGLTLLSLWFYEADDDLILYATTQDCDSGVSTGRPSTSTTSEEGGDGR